MRRPDDLSGEAVAGQPVDDRPIRVADPATLRGHIAAVKDVAFSPDGATLASGSFDMTVRLWPINPNQITPAPAGHRSSPTRRRHPFGRRHRTWRAVIRICRDRSRACS